MTRFVEMNEEDVLNVTGGMPGVFEIVVAVCGLLGISVAGGYAEAEDNAYDKAYKEAYDAEMQRLNLENPIPWGDIIRESYEK